MSPIPLGILAASGGGGATFELIETVAVGSGAPTSITFSNLNTFSTTYQHLQIRYVARVTTNSAAVPIILRFNSDSGSNYDWHGLEANASVFDVPSRAINSTNIRLHEVPGSSATANFFGAGVLDLLDAYESKNKTTRNLFGQAASGNGIIGLRSGHWRNTSAISSLSFTVDSSGGFANGSRFSLYGLRSA